MYQHSETLQALEPSEKYWQYWADIGTESQDSVVVVCFRTADKRETPRVREPGVPPGGGGDFNLDEVLDLNALETPGSANPGKRNKANWPMGTGGAPDDAVTEPRDTLAVVACLRSASSTKQEENEPGVPHGGRLRLQL